jgi:tRNA threonylcarbamoyl adenosine modification protein (Sua5/YciO/YrdC/YwlC family)
MGVIEQAVAAIRAGEPVVLPSDTVYGLATTPHSAEAAVRLYAVKQRPQGMPSALLASDLDTLLGLIPELRGRSETIARTLLPGPYTLVFPNPERRFPWLAGDRPHTIGVRVCPLPEPSREILAQVGAVLATSANLHGRPDPIRADDVADAVRAAVAVVVDGGELPGVRSTIIDFSGEEPEIVREGALPAQEAIDRAVAALG